MKRLIFIGILLVNHFVSAHSPQSNTCQLPTWNISSQEQKVEASFFKLDRGEVVLEDQRGKLRSFPLSDFSRIDQKKIRSIQAKIERYNHDLKILSHSKELQETHSISAEFLKFILLILQLILAGSILFLSYEKYRGFLFFPLSVLGLGMLIYSFKFQHFKKQPVIKSYTDPSFLDSAFLPFVPYINTFHDTTYYYVESHGIPSTHEMMVGISNHGWQQQVPIPQCYIGSNAWSIPLKPALATNPIPVNASHFLRGAIAIAVNGVPIFNVHTNTGVDSYLDGQLDNYGGHCGRGDDYHYHIAPLHLYSYTAATKPIAFALDGFAVYGSFEPDGSVMTALDANHGHFGSNGVYHYHGTTSAPYMIGNMVGEVTEDNTLQIIPQAQASPVRTENWGPLSGALITSCTPNGTNNGYNLSYTLNGISGYATNFSWNTSGLYTFEYVTPTVTTTTTYNGFVPCELISTLGIIEAKQKEFDIQVFPNPTSSFLKIDFNNKLQQEVESILIYSSKGELKMKLDKFKSEIDLRSFEKGIYLVKISFPNSLITKKIVIE